MSRPTDPAEIAKGLSEAQRVLVIGDYDPEFARVEDASKLVSLGIWAWDETKQDPSSEYYELEVTPLGLAVRKALEEG